jgi:hypothetical protein
MVNDVLIFIKLTACCSFYFVLFIHALLDLVLMLFIQQRIFRNVMNLTPLKVPGFWVISCASSVSFRSWCWEITCTFVIVLSCSLANPWLGQLVASLSQKTQVQSDPYGLCRGQSGMGTGFVLITSPSASFHQCSIHIHSPMLVIDVIKHYPELSYWSEFGNCEIIGSHSSWKSRWQWYFISSFVSHPSKYAANYKQISKIQFIRVNCVEVHIHILLLQDEKYWAL